MLPQRPVDFGGMQAGNVADHIGNERPPAPAKLATKK